MYIIYTYNSISDFSLNSVFAPNSEYQSSNANSSPFFGTRSATDRREWCPAPPDSGPAADLATRGFTRPACHHAQSEPPARPPQPGKQQGHAAANLPHTPRHDTVEDDSHPDDARQCRKHHQRVSADRFAVHRYSPAGTAGTPDAD